MKKRLFMRLAALTLVCIVMFTFIGCGQTDTTEAEKTPTAANETTNEGSTNAAATTAASTAAPDIFEKPTTVTILSWWDPTSSTALKLLKAKFEGLHPNVKIEFTRVPSKYADKVITMIAGGGEMPDVMMLAMDQVPRYADAGAIQDLTPYITDEYKAKTYPIAMDALTVNGKVYAVARDVTSMVMYCNKKMFADAGIAIPKEGWTVDDFLEICKQMTKFDKSGKPTQWGYAFEFYPDCVYDWFRIFGADYVSADGKTSTMNTPESKVAMQFINDLMYKYKVTPTRTEVEQFGGNATAAVVAGKAAMIIGGLSMSNSFDTANPPVEYELAPLPIAKDGKPVTHAFVNTWCMPKGAKDAKVSWAVLEYLSSKNGQQIALDEKMGLPASKEVDTSAFLAARPDNKYLMDSISYAVPFKTMLNANAYYNVWKEEMENLWSNAKSVDEIAAAIDTRGNAALAGK